MQQATDNYRALFNSIDEGFHIIELIFDEAGKAVDYLFLETNQSFERHTGLKNATGKRGSEIAPGTEDVWFAAYDKVVQTREPIRFENFNAFTGRWYSNYAFPADETYPNRVAVLFNDITERKRREADASFLNEVSQNLAQLTSLDETMNLLGEKVAAYLDLAAVAFAEITKDEMGIIDYAWHRNDMPNFIGRYTMKDFVSPDVLEYCRTGKDVVINDVFGDPRTDGERYKALNIGSFLSIPLVRDGQWQFLLVVYKSDAYDWPDAEISLTREFAARVWTRLERARAEEALLQSEEKYRTLFNSIDEGFAFFELIYDESGRAIDLIHLETNPAHQQLTGLTNIIGVPISQIVPNLQWMFDLYDRVVRTGKGERIEYGIEALGRIYSVYASRVGGEGSRQLAAVFNDITERKRFEIQLKENYEQIRLATKAANAGWGYRNFITGEAHWDEQGKKILGFPNEEDSHTVEGWKKRVHPEDLLTVEALMAESIREDKPFDLEYRVVRADGETRFVHAMGTFSKDENGTLLKGGGLVMDITERKQQEGHQEFLLKFSDALRTEPTADAVANRALQLLSEHLQLDRCYTATYLLAEDRAGITHQVGNERLPPMPDQIRLSDFPEAFQVVFGRTLVIDDVVNQEGLSETDRQNMKALSFGAFVAATLRKGENQPLWAIVFVSAAPRRWTPGEIKLMEEVTERTWAAVERAKAEAEVKQGEERQTFLLHLNDVLRTISDKVEMQRTASELLVKHLGANRAMYLEFEGEGENAVAVIPGQYADGVPPFPEQITYLDYARGFPLHLLKRHETIVVNDTANDSGLTEPIKAAWLATNVASVVATSFFKNGRMTGNFGIHYAAPHSWTKPEIQLIEQVADRTWAAVERVKAEEALFQSEERFRIALASASMGAWDWNIQTDSIAWNDQHYYLFGLTPDGKERKPDDFFRFVHPEDKSAVSEALKEAVEKTGVYKSDFRIVREDKEVCWMSGYGKVVAYEEGKAVRMAGVMFDVTEQKKAEELLQDVNAALEQRVKEQTADIRQREQTLQGIINAPNVGLAVYKAVRDEGGAIVDFVHEFINRRTQAALGKDMTGRLLSEHGKDGTEQLPKFIETIETGKPNTYIRHSTFGGSEHWILFSNAPIDAERMVHVWEDITELKKAEEEITKNAAILKQSEELAKMGSWEYQHGTGKFIWSDGMYRLFDLPEGSKVEPEIYIQMAVDADKVLARQLVANIRDGSPFEETICLNISGATKIIRIKASPVKDGDESLLKTVGVDIDITESRQAETTLKEQSHFIESTNKALPDILYVLNLTTKELVYINHPFEERLGYAVAAGTENSILHLIYEEDLPAMLRHLEEMKAAADGEVIELEYRLVAADGSLHWFRDRNSVFKRDKQGVGVEKIGIAQDVTARKKAEQELKESNTSLRYANENLQQFASIAAHDLQEPLRKLKLFASVLKRYAEGLPGDATEVIQKIDTTSGRMRQLITEVLQYSKVAYGVKEFVPTELHAILQNVLVDLDLLITETGAAIEYDTPLPEIEAIPPQMNQLFYNLLTNALKFRKEGVRPVVQVSHRMLPSIEVKSHPELDANRPHIEIQFRDNGVGFSQVYAEQIFQLFERLYGADEYEGTGVGLALCKKIVENHHGHIYAKSSDGEGATFYILLPISQTSNYPPPPRK